MSSVKENLTEGHPAVLGISTTEHFYRKLAPPYVISADSNVRGSHAVTAVGYGSTQSDEFILIRNSWGMTWGDSGHAWLDSSFIERHLVLAFVVK
jgi:C1A family cysteine protease